MGESRYEQIRLGKNIRANLIELKQEIREEAKKTPSGLRNRRRLFCLFRAS